MQSYEEDKLLQTVVGKPAELVKQMPPQATHHVLSKIPSAGEEVTIRGIVWVVERVKEQHGWMRLRLKNLKDK